MMGWAMILVCVNLIKSINKICRAYYKTNTKWRLPPPETLTPRLLRSRTNGCDNGRGQHRHLDECHIIRWPKKWKSEIQIITEYQSAEQFSLWSALSHLENGWSSKTCKTCSPKFINLILTLFGNVREHSCSLLCRRWIDWPSFCSPATATLTRKGTRRLWWNNIFRMKRLPIFQPMSGILLLLSWIVKCFFPAQLFWNQHQMKVQDNGQVAEIGEILEMKVTHRKNLTRREKKFGWVFE